MPTDTTFRFDSATAVQVEGDRAYVDLDGDWNVGNGVLNGGYLQAVTTTAARDVVANHTDPVAVSTMYCAPAAAGPAEVIVSGIRRGRSVSSATATLMQGDSVVLQSMVTLGEVSDDSVDAPLLVMPDVPSPSECKERSASMRRRSGPGLGQILETALVPGYDGWVNGEFGKEPRIQAWIHFADSRPLDTMSVVALCDMLPPVGFAIGKIGWAPTLQLQVGIFAKPQGEWLFVDFVGSPYGESFVCEDCDLWDSSGRLIARARQVAMPPRTR